MNKGKLLLVIAITIVINGCNLLSTDKSGATKEAISCEKAIDIVIRGKYLDKELEEYIISCYDEVGSWKEINQFKTPAIKEKIFQLHDQRMSYWMVACFPRAKDVYGGISFVFVDKNNGDIIDVIDLP